MAGLVFAPRGQDWREDVRTIAGALRGHMLARRDMARLIPQGFFFAPRAMGLLETALGVLLDAGLAPRDAFYAFTTAFDFVVGWVRGEATLRERGPTRAGLDPETRALLLDGAAYPNFTRAAEGVIDGGDIDEQFAFGLECLIAGFAARIPAP
jgi:hypothetical protein